MPPTRGIQEILRPREENRLARFLEPAATMASATVAEPVSGIAALLTGNPENVQRVQQALTYNPRTREGQEGLKVLSETFQQLTEALGVDEATKYFEQTIVPNLQQTFGDEAGSAMGAMAMGALAVGRPGRVKIGGLDREKLSREYPATGTPVPNVDKKTGKEFLSKGLSEEELMLQAERQAINKEIKKGNYDPYFDIEERYYADPSKYDIRGDTLTDTLPKKQATIDAKIAKFDTPEGRAALSAAFDAGNNPKAQNWYAMGQLEDEFIRVLGEQEGRKQFKSRFADAMAATTGGADPGSNLLMAAYGNYQKSRGLPPGSASYEMPHPIGGRYVTGNMAMYDKILNKDIDLTAKDQPKRFNFSANFLGDRNRATIDEQMTQGLTGGKFNAPPSLSYGVIEKVIHDEALKRGVKPANLQDVAWSGFKKSEGKPMIEWVNEMIARTSEVTGKTQKQVLEGFINGDMPMYGLGGAALTVGMLQDRRRDEAKEQI